MFESTPSSEPTEEEKRAVEKKLRAESEVFFLDTFSSLPEEEKKERVTKRWNEEKRKAKAKGIPWRMLEPEIENVFKLAGVLAGMTRRFLSDGIKNGVVRPRALPATHIERRYKKTRSFSALTRVPIPNRTSKETPAIEENPFDSDKAELLPEYTYLEQDTVTLPQVENGVGVDFQSTVVSGKINEYAKSEAERYRGDPETALSIEAFYGELNKMLKRGDIDAALRFLDSNLGAGETNTWSNELRAIALQLGEMKREQYGQPKIDFNDATFLLSKNARQLFELYGETQEPSDMEGCNGLMMLLERIQDPTEEGERALKEALAYIEWLLAFRTHQLNRSLHRHSTGRQDTELQSAEECRMQVEEAQRMRDAILEELEKRSEQSENGDTEDDSSANPDSPESEKPPVPLAELLKNPNLELPEADSEDMRTVIQRLEEDVRTGEGGAEEMYWEKEMLEQLRTKLEEGTPEGIDRVTTILSGYVRREIGKKIKEVINRTDITINFEDKKRLLYLSNFSDKILNRQDSVGRVRGIRNVEDQVDELLEKLAEQKQ